jgi:uncharacterized protein YeaO (DUF488 family)
VSIFYNIIKTKRIYDTPSAEDGYRILVDKLWPRGLNKEDAKLDEWAKNLAPSNSLRKWFDHKEDKFEEFSQRYKEELLEQEDGLKHILELASNKDITLLYAAKNTRLNNAVVLLKILKSIENENKI